MERFNEEIKVSDLEWGKEDSSFQVILPSDIQSKKSSLIKKGP
jgi:hypothetical protein